MATIDAGTHTLLIGAPSQLQDELCRHLAAEHLRKYHVIELVSHDSLVPEAYSRAKLRCSTDGFGRYEVFSTLGMNDEVLVKALATLGKGHDALIIYPTAERTVALLPSDSWLTTTAPLIARVLHCRVLTSARYAPGPPPDLTQYPGDVVYEVSVPNTLNAGDAHKCRLHKIRAGADFPDDITFSTRNQKRIVVFTLDESK